MLLPAEALRRRISRAQAILGYLDRLQAVELDAYKGDIALQLRIERGVQLLTQALVDVGESILDRKRTLEDKPRASEGGNLMTALAGAGVLDPALAERLADTPSLALTLVHEHVEVDPREVWRVWRERRADFSAAAAALAAYLNRNRIPLQL